MTPVEALAEAELHGAIARIEAALNLAFSGDAGQQRLARAAAGQERGEFVDDEALRSELAAVLADLDRLESVAGSSGLENWLRRASTSMLDISLLVSGRMRADPFRSLQAQAGRALAAVRDLRD